jgi:glycosyltransferase involved in cell wall biosynthesis
MKVILAGQFQDASGYGNAARNFLKAFDKNNIREKIDFYILSVSFEKENNNFLSDSEMQLLKKYHISEKQIQEDDGSIVISFHTPNIAHYFMLDEQYDYNFFRILNKAKKIINMVVWETDSVPSTWKEWLKKDIIIPCSWNKEVFSKDTSANIYMLPYPLDKQDKRVFTKTDTFNILSISQWNKRKGFDTLIKAYAAEFFNNEDVCLTIKTYRNEYCNPDKEQEKQIIIQEASFYKSSISSYGKQPKAKIKIIPGIISKDSVLSLYANASVFALATRGEGFGLTIAEAASKGLPCVVPDKGGHIDFLDKQNNFLYESRYSSVQDCHAAHYSSTDMKYVESDFDSLRVSLRKAYNIWKKDQKQLYKMGENTKNFIDLYLDDVNITNTFLDIIKGLHE